MTSVWNRSNVALMFPCGPSVSVRQTQNLLAERRRQLEPGRPEGEEVGTLRGQAAHDGRPHDVARGPGVVGDADVDPGDQLHRGRVPPGPPGPLGHALPEEPQQRLGDAALHDRAVGDAARHPTAGLALGGDVDRHPRARRREVEPAVVEPHRGAFHRHRLPGEEPADQLHRLPDGHGRPRRIDAQLTEAGHARAEAEQRASARDLVERGDGHGGQRSVA
jgi:hypothetical protein